MQQGECGENSVSHQQPSPQTPAEADVSLPGLGFREKPQGPRTGASSWLGCRQGCVQLAHRLGWCVVSEPLPPCVPLLNACLIWRSDAAAECEGRSYKPFENVLASLTSLKSLQARASLSKFLWWRQIQKLHTTVANAAVTSSAVACMNLRPVSLFGLLFIGLGLQLPIISFHLSENQKKPHSFKSKKNTSGWWHKKNIFKYWKYSCFVFYFFFLACQFYFFFHARAALGSVICPSIMFFLLRKMSLGLFFLTP